MIDDTKFMNLKRRAQEIRVKRKKKISSQKNIHQIVEDLDLYQIELEIQNEDLIKTQLELQESHKKYTDLYNLAPIAYFTCNKEGLIMDVNQAGSDLLGIKKSRLINRCFSRYIAPEFQMLFSQHRKHAFKESSLITCELKMIRWSGRSTAMQEHPGYRYITTTFNLSYRYFLSKTTREIYTFATCENGFY